jgi:hypothetical protein
LVKQSIVIHVFRQTQESACAWCGREVAAAAGPQLALPDTLALVCRECGQAHAPVLAALVQLAQVAERVGTIVRRNQYWIPLRAQLDVVHAAEGFSRALEEDSRRERLTVNLSCDVVNAPRPLPTVTKALVRP